MEVGPRVDASDRAPHHPLGAGLAGEAQSVLPGEAAELRYAHLLLDLGAAEHTREVSVGRRETLGETVAPLGRHVTSHRDATRSCGEWDDDHAREPLFVGLVGEPRGVPVVGHEALRVLEVQVGALGPLR